jgi:hypothetical protein
MTERMSGLIVIVLGLMVLGLTPTVAFPADWSLFFMSRAEVWFYIDKESMQKTPEGTILVWEKLESTDAAPAKIRIEQLNEVDCFRRRYKILKGTAYGEKMETFGPDKDWTYFEPNDLDHERYNVMCDKGKKK